MTLTGLPAGSYVFSASLWAGNSDTTAPARFYCDLYSGATFLVEGISDLPPSLGVGHSGAATMALTTAGPVAAGDPLKLVCASLAGDSIQVFQPRLTAVKVGTVTGP